MRDGVGPDCRQRYGPRPQYQPNPSYAEWQRRVEDNRREQEATQREYDRAYAADLLDYERRLAEWQAEASTPSNVARADAVRVATRTMYVDLGVIASLILSDLVARTAAGVMGNPIF